MAELTVQRPSASAVTVPPMKLVVPTKSATNLSRRLLVDLARRADLDHAALVHHRDLVRERQRLALVVGDVDGGEIEFALQPLELGAHAVAQLGVEIGERLVEQEKLRLHHQRAREREPLLLAAGELGGVAVDQLGRARPRRARASPARGSPSWAAGAPRAGTPRSGTRSCAARWRRTGTPCRNCACWARRRCPCPRSRPRARRPRSRPPSASPAPRSSARSWSCRSRTARAA